MRKSSLMATAWVAMFSVTGAVLASDKAASLGRTPHMERPSKITEVTVRPISDVPQPGHDKVTTDSGQMLYVGRDVLFTSTDVVASAAGSDVNTLSLTLSGGKAGVVPGRVAVYIGGSFVGAPFATKNSDGTITLAGLEPAQTARLTRHLIVTPEPTGALITLVPDTNQIEPGQVVEVKAFIDGAVDLRAYQVAVDVTGGTQGEVTVKDIFVDTNHPDWVFSELQAVSAANRPGARLMGALYNGGINVDERKYAGTIVLEASPTARGAFVIGLRQNTETTLRNPDSVPMSFVADAPIVLDVNPRVAPGSRR